MLDFVLCGYVVFVLRVFYSVVGSLVLRLFMNVFIFVGV